MLDQRILITGIGLETALGDTEATWRNLQSGKIGLQRLDHLEGRFPVPLFGYPLAEAPTDPIDLVHRLVHRAIEDADVAIDAIDPERIAVVIGLSKGDLSRLRRWRDQLQESPKLLDDIGEDWTFGWPNGATRRIPIQAKGPRLAPVAACATGLVAVLRAASLIRTGQADLAIAGAVDTPLDPFVLGAFSRLGVFARVVDPPETSVRPWDIQRTGFLPGAGGAILILERADHVLARRKTPIAELSGGALGADATHLTNLDPDPSRLARLIADGLLNAGVQVNEIGAVNLHGTGTRSNDPLESRALRLAFGRHAEAISCSANKAQIGHLLGGSGAAELAITCLSIRDQFVPPSMNLYQPDPACDLDATPLVGRAREIKAALKLSMGFGGHLAVAVLREPRLINEN